MLSSDQIGLIDLCWLPRTPIHNSSSMYDDVHIFTSTGDFFQIAHITLDIFYPFACDAIKFPDVKNFHRSHTDR